MPMPHRGVGVASALDRAARHLIDSRMTRTRWVAVCLLLLTLAACGGSAHGTATRSSFPALMSQSGPNPSASATAAALAAYTGTYADVEAAVRAGDASSPLLGRHAIPPAEYQLQSDAEQYLKLGVVPVGMPALHAQVASLDLAESPQQAIVTACPGAPRLVDLKTGQPVAAQALPPNPFTVTLQTTQGHWAVSYFKIDRSKTCSG